MNRRCRRPIGWALAFATVMAASCTGGPHVRAATSPSPGPLSSTGLAPAGGSPSSPVPTAGPPNRSELDAVRVRLVRVAYLSNPISMTVDPGDDELYVAQRQGLVRTIVNGRLQPRSVLDLSKDVSLAGSQGLLSIVFSPSGTEFYACYTDHRGTLRIVQYRVRDGTILTGSARDILSIAIPSTSHQGGMMAFGPDGDLWLSVGDGTEGKDLPGYAQNLGVLLGKLLRIEPRASGKPYAVPHGNPFVHRQGARSEIYAYGLREPWRFSFDRDTGDLWLGDVGQYSIEEVDFLPAGRGAGANFGWNRMEGTRRFSGTPPLRQVLPLAEYPHTHGRCAVIGGYVYRGERIQGLQGAYVYADLCDGKLRALVQHNGRLAFQRELGPRMGTIASFGEDGAGEQYVLSQYSGLFELAPAAS